MLRLSSIVEYLVFLCTCVFLNRMASFEKRKIKNNKYENTISPEDGWQS